MNNPYIILALGWIVGQIGHAAVSVYVLQKDKNINYWKACGLYFGAEIGGMIMAFAGLLIILFIAGDYITDQITIADLRNKQVLTWKEKAIVYQRTFSVVIGIFIQHLLYVGFKRGKKRIEQYERENDISDK